MCIEYLLPEDPNERVKFLAEREQYENDTLDGISEAIIEYLKDNPPLEDGLKDYLFDLKQMGLIKGCGCEGVFKLENYAHGWQVFIQPLGSQVYKIIILDDDYSYYKSDRQEAYPEEYRIVYNEYRE
jgi:hypothetical protein